MSRNLCSTSTAFNFYTAGDDFEYQVPSSSNFVGGGIYTPQSKSTGAEVIVNAGIGDSKVQPLNTMYSSTCIGEHFTSIKQLLNRICQLQPRQLATWASFQYHFYPYFVTGYTGTATTGALRGELFAADAYSFFAPMYQYFRGSSRVMCNAGNSLRSGLDPMYYKFASVNTFVSDTAAISGFGRNVVVTDYPAPDKNPVNSIVQTMDNVSLTAFQQGTYQNMYPVSFVHVWQGEGTNYYSDDTTPATSVVLTTNSPTTSFGTNTTFYRSFCDEFQLSFFLACPPLFIASTPVTMMADYFDADEGELVEEPQE